MKRKHPFPPMHIEAHAGSSIIIGGIGHTATTGNAGPADELEAELLASFRTLPVRDRVEIMQAIYEKQKALA